jgi:TusE/DsrC/DsvC family sulfur relay protein
MDRMVETSRRYEMVIAAIDAANSRDPRTVAEAGASRPYEVVYSERMNRRLALMYPQASELLRIAAHGQHIRRFDIPRADYPPGREGYNEWRRACREHHARLLADLMRRHGYDAAEIEHVARMVRKEQLKKDKDSQALENVVDVVFLEHYLEEFLGSHSRYDDAKVIDIIGKTLRKMSPHGHRAALGLELPQRTRRLLLAAIERDAAALARLAEAADKGIGSSELERGKDMTTEQKAGRATPTQAQQMVARSMQAILDPASAAGTDPRFRDAPPGWTPGRAEALAVEAGVALNEDVWEVIRVLQGCYKDEASPRLRLLCDALEARFAGKGGMKYLYEILPGGPVLQGCTLAGLKPPAGARDLSFGSVA